LRAVAYSNTRASTGFGKTESEPINSLIWNASSARTPNPPPDMAMIGVCRQLLAIAAKLDALARGQELQEVSIDASSPIAMAQTSSLAR
jgi:hypothetical protein